jgi:hypothetical protein
VQLEDGSFPLQLTMSKVETTPIAGIDTAAIRSAPGRFAGSSGAPVFNAHGLLIGVSFCGDPLGAASYHISALTVFAHLDLLQTAAASLNRAQQFLRLGGDLEQQTYNESRAAIPYRWRIVCPDFFLRQFLLLRVGGVVA